MTLAPRRTRAVFAALLLCAAALAPHRAHAQSAPTTPASDAPNADADAHFRRGVELFKERSFDAAMAEFRRAHQLAPSYRVLYNVARCHMELRQLADAYRTYREYLEQGGADVPAERRASVEAELSRLERRVARVRISANVDGARVLCDDEPVGALPMREPLVVDTGRRRISVEAPGHFREARVVELVGGDDIVVRMELRPESATADSRPLPAAALPAADPAAPPSKDERRFPWTTLGLVTTGVLVAGATTTAILALGAKSERATLLERGPGDPAELDRYASRAQSFAIATDVLLASSLILGGITVWHALATRTDRDPPRASSSAGVDLRLELRSGGASMGGTF